MQQSHLIKQPATMPIGETSQIEIPSRSTAPTHRKCKHGIKIKLECLQAYTNNFKRHTDNNRRRTVDQEKTNQTHVK